MDVIYRVQKTDGEGPYQAEESTYVSDLVEMVDSHNDDWYHPLLCADNGFAEDSGLYGFRTIEQLKEWFTKEELKMLENYYFYVYKITGIKVLREDDCQLIFSIEDDYNQEYMPLESIYGE